MRSSGDSWTPAFAGVTIQETGRATTSSVTAPEADFVGEGLACRRGERCVFAGLSFRLPPGAVLVLTGTNGSGKTSLLRLLAGLTPPAGGRLCWGGLPIGQDPAAHRARLHYIGHQDGIKPGLTPRETLRFWSALRGCDGPDAAAQFEAAIAVFGLEHIADWPCRWLSAGQRRRLALARLSASKAPLWLLDEPTSALDRENQSRLETLIGAHRASGGRVVLTTHIPLEIEGALRLVLDDFAAAAAS
jgi:heme exporter protein A